MTVETHSKTIKKLKWLQTHFRPQIFLNYSAFVRPMLIRNPTFPLKNIPNAPHQGPFSAKNETKVVKVSDVAIRTGQILTLGKAQQSSIQLRLIFLIQRPFDLT